MIFTRVASSIATQPAVAPPSVECRKNAPTVTGHPGLVHAHHHGVGVLRNLEVLGTAARVGVERTLRLLAHLHGVVGRALHIAVPPVIRTDLDVLQPTARVGLRAEGEVEGEYAHRGGFHFAVVGLRCHSVGPDMRRDSHADRLPARRRALPDIHFRRRTAHADNRDDLSRGADRIGEPRGVSTARATGGTDPPAPHRSIAAHSISSRRIRPSSAAGTARVKSRFGHGRHLARERAA